MESPVHWDTSTLNGVNQPRGMRLGNLEMNKMMTQEQHVANYREMMKNIMQSAIADGIDPFEMFIGWLTAANNVLDQVEDLLIAQNDFEMKLIIEGDWSTVPGRLLLTSEEITQFAELAQMRNDAITAIQMGVSN